MTMSNNDNDNNNNNNNNNNNSAASSNAAAIIPNITPIQVAEQVEIMRLQEESTYKCNDYFGEGDCNMGNSFHHAPQHLAVTPESRRKMCEWCCQIIDFCHFRRETVDIAMSYLDRFLTTGGAEAQKTLRDTRQYQLAAMTGLYMAIKLHEPMEMETSLLAEISRGEYSAEEIAQMERTMLTALQWRVNGPTRLTFALQFMALLPANLRNNTTVAETLLEWTHAQTERATADYYFTTRKQSTAGLACVLNTLEAMRLGKNIVHAFMDATIRYGGMNPFSTEVQEARRRLMRTADGVDYAISNKVLSSNAPSSSMQCQKVSYERCVEKDMNKDKESSPVCVSRTAIEQ